VEGLVDQKALGGIKGMRELIPGPQSSVLQRKCAGGGSSKLGGERKHWNRQLGIQRHLDEDPEPSSTVPPIVHEVLRSSGQPLDSQTRTFMESRFSHDFSRVRVHSDTRAAESARAVNALAYTVGINTVFANGQYAPQTFAGRRLLAHELTHVIQQNNLGSSSAVDQVEIGPSLDSFERQAQSAEERVAKVRTGSTTEPTLSAPTLQRTEAPEEAPTGQETAPLPGGPEGMPETEPDPMQSGRTDAFGKECPDTVVIGDKKAIPAFNKKIFDAGFRSYFGLVSNMKVGPKDNYEACITEVLKVEENTCGDQGNMADYKPCTPKKHCMQVNKACGGDDLTDTSFPCSPNTFVDLHRTDRNVSLLEGSGKTECKVKCLQRYGCGGKEIGRFYVTRNFKADTYTDGKNKVPITTGSIEKEPASK
jgi:Domain of unknown function (DUF4157)